MKPATSQSFLITSGDGPAECNLAVAGILPLMINNAQAYGFDVDISEIRAKHGLKSAVIVLHGGDTCAFAKRWCGTIQWRAQSKLRSGHKRENWFIGVFALGAHPYKGIRLQTRDVRYETFRAGGPGGQHQNTTDSAVRAVHEPTGLTAVAREMRSQHRNKALAFLRLQTLMDAQAMADQAAGKASQNSLHHKLKRGNPVHRFKGARFQEVGGAG